MDDAAVSSLCDREGQGEDALGAYIRDNCARAVKQRGNCSRANSRIDCGIRKYVP